MSASADTEKKLKLVEIDGATAVVLPEELLAWLHLEPGDQLVWSKNHDGILLSSCDGEFNRQMKVAREIMEHDREALRKLANS